MKIFIISWMGQHKKASQIAESILNSGNSVTIVFSDPDQNLTFNNSFNLIRRPNDLFWADKFKSCLDAAGNDGILIIHADCECDDWMLLINRCNHTVHKYKDIGVWAPETDGTQYNLSVSGIYKIKESSLVLSAFVDGIVFYISPFIIKRMLQVNYEKNMYGWGIDRLFCSYSHISKKLVVIDTSVNVSHNDEETGYDRKLAFNDNVNFLTQFSLNELVQDKLIRTYLRFNRIKISPQDDNSV